MTLSRRNLHVGNARLEQSIDFTTHAGVHGYIIIIIITKIVRSRHIGEALHSDWNTENNV